MEKPVNKSHEYANGGVCICRRFIKIYGGFLLRRLATLGLSARARVTNIRRIISGTEGIFDLRGRGDL
jgi:hypothetical protein